MCEREWKVKGGKKSHQALCPLSSHGSSRRSKITLHKRHNTQTEGSLDSPPAWQKWNDKTPAILLDIKPKLDLACSRGFVISLAEEIALFPWYIYHNFLHFFLFQYIDFIIWLSNSFPLSYYLLFFLYTLSFSFGIYVFQFHLLFFPFILYWLHYLPF